MSKNSSKANIVKSIATKDKQERKRALFNWALLFLLICFCVIRAMQRTTTSDFSAIDGDWQNYNPCRRLLAGQIPFQDFSVYLGLGHLYIGSFLLLIFGNNFTASMFSMAFATVLLFELWSFGIPYIIWKDKTKALLFSLLMTLFNFTRSAVSDKVLGQFSPSFDFGVSAGNSARMIRGSAPIVLALLAWLGLRVIDKLKVKRTIILTHEPLVKKCYAGLIAGIFFTWGNDYGIASYICFSFVYLMVLIKIYRKNIKQLLWSVLLYLIASIAGCFIILLIATRGHIDSWLRFTLGAGKYQSWYFGTTPADKSFFLYNIDTTLLTVLCLILVIVYLYKMFKMTDDGSLFTRYALPAFLLLTGYAAANEYQLLSGGGYHEMTYLILFLIISAEGLRFLKSLCQPQTIRRLGTVAVAAVVILSSAKICSTGMQAAINKMPSHQQGEYIKGLNGNVTDLASSLKIAQAKIGNQKIFSTYATAAEAITNQFQPSGTDYIIHVLGDTQRENYLNTFRQGNFKYAATIRGQYSPWEYWICNANWFFYRELYKNYKPAFATGYQLYWEKSDQQNVIHPKMQVITTVLNNHSVNISISTDTKVNGTADVAISYTTRFNKRFLKTMAFQRMVFVQESTERSFTNTGYCNFFLPQNSMQNYIPITVINGHGEAVLDSYPQNCTDLTVEKASADEIFEEPFQYLVLSDLTDGTWDNGVGRQNAILLFPNTQQNKIALQNATSLKSSDGSTVKIVMAKEKDDFLQCYVSDKSNGSKFAYPNVIEVVK